MYNEYRNADLDYNYKHTAEKQTDTYSMTIRHAAGQTEETNIKKITETEIETDKQTTNRQTGNKIRLVGM